ncbi:MAG: ATP-binding cassette domain-containing protein [Verrucomicrobiales bacterium]
MKGYLIDPAGQPLAELPKADFPISFQNSQLLPGQATGQLVLWLHWDAQRCSWSVGQHHPELFLDGSPARFAPRQLARESIFQLGGLQFTLRQELDLPKWGDKAANTHLISPKTSPITIGRGEAEGTGDGSRFSLDPDARIISSQHLRLSWQDGSWQAEDLSRSGTELNGSLFSKAELVYGDRLRVGPYQLEFRGDRLLRIDHLQSGKVQARELGVVVKDRQSGKPLHIARNVSLDIEPGEFVGILGVSGQGKSTILNALCGISAATEGQVTIGGVPVAELIAQKPGHVGFVPQDDIVHRELSIDQALRASAKLRVPLRGEELKKLIDRTIELLGLEEHRRKRIDQLSGGQRKRVSIAIELLSKPDVLFLDEPSSGLDPATEASLMRLLQKLALTRLTIICTTHVLQNAYLFNRVLFVHGGRLIFSGTTDEARAYFLSEGTSDSSQANLEKIYPTVLDSTRSAEEWEERYLAYRKAPAPLETAPDKAGKPSRVSWFTKLRVLLSRQWNILRAEKLNLAFLAMQVVVIGAVISWISEEPGFRMFLGLIAAMWFGCSNGAQQIVGELPIFFRERVCGLGNATYLTSKVLFQGFVSVLQALVLFLVIITASNLFYPDDWDSERFRERLYERENPLLADFSEPDGGADVFVPVGDDGLALPGDEEIEMPPPAEEAEEEIAAAEEPPAFAAQLWLLEPVARWFNLEENVLDSGPKPLTYADGGPILGPDQIQKTTPGMSLWGVITTSIALRVAAFALVAFVGVIIGLLVSSLVNTTIQAVMWIPLLLIPQILFGGYVVPLIDMDALRRSVAQIFPSYAGQRLIDVSHVYGRRLPRIANETENPVFLSPEGDKEVIEWQEGGRELSENYDKFSDVNRSWQNLAVYMERVGQRKKEREAGSQLGQYITPSSVDERADVKYKHGTVYANPAPAQHGLGILSAWFGLCLVLTYLSLRRRH